MSSTNVTSTPSPPSTERIMPSASGSSSNTGLGSPGMNFFFGFLIAFIALLLFFVGCGYGARRSLMVRRRVQQRLELEEAEAAVPEGAMFGDLEGLVVMRKGNAKLPVFWDRWIESGDEKKEWESMMPLGAMVVSEGVDDAPPPSLYSPRLPATPNWLRPRTPEARNWRRSIQSMIVVPFALMFVDPRPTHSRSVSETLSSSVPPPPAAGGNNEDAAISLHTLSRTGSRHPSVVHSPPPSAPEENNTPASDDDGDVRKSTVSEDPPIKPPPPPLVNVQVMVMIAMPSDKKEELEEQRIPHIQFGITRVPVLCDDDESML